MIAAPKECPTSASQRRVEVAEIGRYLAPELQERKLGSERVLAAAAAVAAAEPVKPGLAPGFGDLY